jgi:hypothetical protein
MRFGRPTRLCPAAVQLEDLRGLVGRGRVARHAVGRYECAITAHEPDRYGHHQPEK